MSSDFLGGIPGSRELGPAVPALTGFDPGRDCSICGETFDRSNDLYEHLRAHGHDRQNRSLWRDIPDSKWFEEREARSGN